MFDIIHLPVIIAVHLKFGRMVDKRQVRRKVGKSWEEARLPRRCTVAWTFREWRV